LAALFQSDLISSYCNNSRRARRRTKTDYLNAIIVGFPLNHRAKTRGQTAARRSFCFVVRRLAGVCA
jgi:hypothetical protein